MYVTFSKAVSFFLVPITFIHSKDWGTALGYTLPAQGCVYEATQYGCRGLQIYTCHTAVSLGLAHVSYGCGRRSEASAIKCSISLRCYFTENHAPFSGHSVPGSVSDVHSSDAHKCLQAGQVAPPKAKCKTCTELSSPEKKEFQKARKPDKTDCHSSKL